MHKSPRPALWLWPNLLSLDAPLVALVWQDFLVRCYPATLRPAGRLALGLTVWAIYIADRLLDVRKPACGTETPRHQFYRRHKRLWLAVLCAILVLDAGIAIARLRPIVAEYGLLVLPGILAYLAIFVLPGRGASLWKKLLAGLFFTSGVFLMELNTPLKIALPSAAFFLLCTGNLLLVELWEQGTSSVNSMATLLAALAFACLCAGFRDSGLWFRAVAVSAAALSALAFSRDALPVNARCVLADAVLLSPLLFR